MGANMKVLERKDPKMVIPKKENFQKRFKDVLRPSQKGNFPFLELPFLDLSFLKPSYRPPF